MKKHIFLAGILVMLLSSCSDFLDYNENSDYDQNKLFNTTWSNTDLCDRHLMPIFRVP